MDVQGSLRRTVAGCGVLVLAGAVLGCNGAGVEKTVPATMGSAEATVLAGFVSPESSLPVGDRWFVSNMGAPDPLAKDGNGFVSELKSDGSALNSKVVPRPGDPPLNAPKGMASIDHTVFVADIDRVVGFDLDTFAQVFEATVEGDAPSLLNDIAVRDPGTLLVTDSARGEVHTLDLANRKFETLADGIPGANGIAIDNSGGLAYVAAAGAQNQGGELWAVELGPAPVVMRKVGTVHGILDGVQILRDGNLVVSDWVSADDSAGVITIYKPDGTEVQRIPVPAGLRGPADIQLAPGDKALWVASIPDDQVFILAVP
ncbi:SMP-30/gluconolactonase/LRE family protein [Nocardia sp. IFM 10818]